MGTEWTIKTLKKYIERRFLDNGTALDAALKSTQKAIDKAESAQTAYNDRSNEFRGALDDQAKLQLSRTEAEGKFQQLRELIERNSRDIVELQKGESRDEGGIRTQASYRQLFLAVVGLSITVLLAGAGGIGTLIFYLVTRP
jgi:uncharacterized protein related to proFAR isomerase